MGASSLSKSRSHSECCASPDEAPGSPRGVASVQGTLSTLTLSQGSSHAALSAAAEGAPAPGVARAGSAPASTSDVSCLRRVLHALFGGALPCTRAAAPFSWAAAHEPPPRAAPPPPLWLQFSSSLQLDGAMAQPLLALGGHGLRHFRVPQHLHCE